MDRAINPCDIANSNTYNNYIIRAEPYRTQLPQGQPRIPYPYIPRRVLPAITSDSPNTACIASYSNGHNSGLTSSSNLHLPAALPSQASHLPPGPVPLARPEEQKIHVAPPQKPQGSLRFKCREQVCGKASKFPSQLIEPTCWYKGCEDFFCSLPRCKLQFKTNSDLEIHMKTHTRDKPYWCDTCEKFFNTSRCVVRHLMLHHTREIVCSEPGCGKILTRRSHVTPHLHWHKAQENFCDSCGLAFYCKRDVERHMLTIHTGEKPYKCDICEKCFFISENFNVHKQTHIQGGNLEIRGTENQGATHSEAMDVPVPEEGGSTEDKELNIN